MVIIIQEESDLQALAVVLKEETTTHPEALRVYGIVSSIIKNLATEEVLVDVWPNFTAVITRPRPEIYMGESYELKCISIYNKGTVDDLVSFLSNGIFDWTKEWTLSGIPLDLEMSLLKLLKENGKAGRWLTCDHLVSSRGSLPMFLDPPSDYKLTAFNQSMVDKILSGWKIDSDFAKSLLLFNGSNFPSSCCINNDGEDNDPSAHVFTSYNGSISMLNVVKGHKGKGLAQAVLCDLAIKLFNDGLPVWACIETNNKKTKEVFINSGFKSSGLCSWINFQPESSELLIEI